MERPIFFGSCLAKGDRDKTTIGIMGRFPAGRGLWAFNSYPITLFRNFWAALFRKLLEDMPRDMLKIGGLFGKDQFETLACPG